MRICKQIQMFSAIYPQTMVIPLCRYYQKSQKNKAS